MSTMTNQQATEPPKGAGPDEIEDHIEQTRQDLGRTVEALSHKLDVKSRAQEKMAMARERASATATRMKASVRRPATLMIAGGTAAAAAVAGAVAVRKREHGRLRRRRWLRRGRSLRMGRSLRLRH